MYDIYKNKWKQVNLYGVIAIQLKTIALQGALGDFVFADGCVLNIPATVS